MRAGDFNTATAAYSTSEDPQYDKCQLPIGYVVPDAVYDSDDLINNIFDTLQETTSDLAFVVVGLVVMVALYIL